MKNQKKHIPFKRVPAVQVLELLPTAYQIVLSATGTVRPARQMTLRSRVSGEVVAVHAEFKEGGLLPRGAIVVTLDDIDYRLALALRQRDAVNSQSAFKVEQGRQAVAKQEWQILGYKADDNQTGAALALRKPHLEKARANVEGARIQVQKAQLDLERTRIKVPFNALVIACNIDIGSQVSPQDPLAILVGTDNYWIQAAIPVDRLEKITIPKNNTQVGSPTTVHCAGGQRLEGRVIRLLGDLDAKGHMAHILLEVRDPLRRAPSASPGLPLLIGEYVSVDIQGETLQNVMVIPRTSLRDGEAVWLLAPDMTLDIHHVVTIWRDRKSVVVQNGLHNGDQLIVTDLAGPVDGMQLRLASDKNLKDSPVSQ